MLPAEKKDWDERRHEEVFVERRARLSAQALRLTENDRAQAEDLVQDAFVQFTLGRPALGSIGNLDGYLYTMLRNLRLSQVRRAGWQRERALPLVDYDSAELGLSMIDPRGRLRARAELREVCRYACARKESSKSGSVLILRFFHGYYPREIAQVMRATRAAVEERLRAARNEARRFLEDPRSLHFMHAASNEARQPSAPARGGLNDVRGVNVPRGVNGARDVNDARGVNDVHGDVNDSRGDDARGVVADARGGNEDARGGDEDILTELRRSIFASRRGECLTARRLAEFYAVESADAPDAPALAHLVSCRACLGEANRLLGLAPLSERFPSDTFGNDATRGGGSDGGDDTEGGDDDMKRGGNDTDGGGGGGTTTGAGAELRRMRRRARDVYEHRPQELLVSADGRLLATQRVGAELCEQTINLKPGEWVEFVEVFSEQGVRLLFIQLEGAARMEAHAARVELSDGRALEATLNLRAPWSSLQVVYRDPLSRPANAQETAEAAARPEAAPAETRARGRGSRLAGVVAGAISKAGARARGLSLSPGLWLRPGTLTAAVAVLVAAVLLLTRTGPRVSAAELLRRSAAAESASAADRRLALHRTIIVQELQGGGRPVVVRRLRVEVWGSAARGVEARRVFDERGALVAGEWKRPDGTSTVYRAGSAPRDATAGDADARLLSGEPWLVDLSAREFASLSGGAEGGSVREDEAGYFIDYRPAAGARAALVAGSLKLVKPDLRATEQTLRVARGDGEVEYRFVESGFVRERAERVAPSVFTPEPELIGDDAGGRGSALAPQLPDSAPPADAPAAKTAAAGAAPASPELEIEVNYLLGRIKANLGEQVSVERTAAGTLRVEALVETARRKEEILRALAPVAGNPAVAVEVLTVAEASERRRAARPGGAGDEIEVSGGRIPADAELRRHFAARGVGPERVEDEIEQFARSGMARARQALAHASALERLARRFTPAELRALAPAARAKWAAMMREQAAAYRRASAGLRAELRPVFSPGGVEAARPVEPVGEANLGAAGARLSRLAQSHDEAVRAAFTLSDGRRSADALKSPQFWRGLAEAEALASAIEAASRD